MTQHTTRDLRDTREIDQTSQQQRADQVQLALPHRSHIGSLDRLDYAIRSRGSKIVVLALVANTMVAQLLYNSAGQLVLGSGVLLAYLLISAFCSTLAFALFEVSTIFQLHDLTSLDASIKTEIGAEKLIKRGYIVLAVSSVINFLSILYFLGLAWHTVSGHASRFPLDDLPSPWNWGYYAVHALAYTAVLFLAGIFGERPKSSKEIVLATQRVLEQQALEAWQLQKQADIAAMLRRGEPLAAVAAALASPETAERIAVLEAATQGQMSALEAARLNLRQAGKALTFLDGLPEVVAAAHAAMQQHGPSDGMAEAREGEEVRADHALPLAMTRHR